MYVSKYMTSNTVKVTFTLPIDLVAKLNMLFSKGEKSKIVKEALSDKIELTERQKTFQMFENIRKMNLKPRDGRDSLVILKELRAERDAKFGL